MPSAWKATSTANFAREQIQSRVPVQGNVDPLVLREGGAALDREVDDVLNAFSGGPFIFNLGHGILPDTPIAHVEQMLKRVQGISQVGKQMYLWLKALHIIAVIAWMAGMLYLPRLFVYHCAAAPGSEQSETFKVMERRLLKAIIDAGHDRDLAARHLRWSARATGSPPPGSRSNSCWSSAMTGRARLFGALGQGLRRRPQPRISQKFYRIVNEIPTVLMIAIVILATVKPF